MPSGTQPVPRGMVSVDVAASCTAVFDLIHDYGRRLEWDTLLSKACLLDGASEAGLGVRSLCVGTWRGGYLPLETKYIRFEPGRVAAVSLTNRPPFFEQFAATIRHDSMPDDRSRVTYIYFFRSRPRLAAPLLEPIMNFMLRRETQKRLHALREYLASVSGNGQRGNESTA